MLFTSSNRITCLLRPSPFAPAGCRLLGRVLRRIRQAICKLGVILCVKPACLSSPFVFKYKDVVSLRVDLNPEAPLGPNLSSTWTWFRYVLNLTLNPPSP